MGIDLHQNLNGNVKTRIRLYRLNPLPNKTVDIIVFEFQVLP